ncbi:MAG: PIG-L family deacetylase, partial [Verrucomicrobiota bacterium]
MTEFPPEGLSPASRVTVLAPHPDDEALGTGGLIQQALARGAAVRVVLLTDGAPNNPAAAETAAGQLKGLGVTIYT